MNHIALFESFLDSNYAPLYHWTDQLCAILTTNKLRSRSNTLDFYDVNSDKVMHGKPMSQHKAHASISFTREINFSFTYGLYKFRLVFNTELMKRNYSFTPYDAYSAPNKYTPSVNNTKSNPRYRNAYDKENYLRSPVEFEEVLLNQEVDPLHRYLIGIDFSAATILDEMTADALYRYINKHGQLTLRTYQKGAPWKTTPIDLETLLPKSL